jgi:CHAD domain-containing protein
MAKAHQIDDLVASSETRDALPNIFSVRIAELWSWAEHMPHPERVRELHDMRIAAKRVRYCFEFFQPCFAPEFKEVLRRFKQLQDFLGEIHDCDVWVDYLRAQLADAFKELGGLRKGLNAHVGADQQLRTAALELSSHLSHGPAQGLLLMIDDVVQRRQRLYAGLLEFWRECESSGFRGELTRAVAAAAQHSEESLPA